MEPNQEFVTVLENPNPGILGLIKSLLDDANIPYLVKGELDYENQFTQLQVKYSDEQNAREIIQSIDFNIENKSTPIIEITKVKGYRWKLALIIGPILIVMIWQLIRVALEKQ